MLLLQTVIERQCNASQMQALQAGLEGNPLVLIQVGGGSIGLEPAGAPVCHPALIIVAPSCHRHSAGGPMPAA